MDRKALKKVAVRLNRGAVRGSSAYLARVLGVSQPTLRAWMTDPTDEANYRRMPRSARRLLATVVLLDGAGLLDDELIEAINKFDQLLNEGEVRLDQALTAFNALVASDGDEDAAE